MPTNFKHLDEYNNIKFKVHDNDSPELHFQYIFNNFILTIKNVK